MRKNNDINFMHHALALAQKGAGQVSPNPLVGCVLVKNGKIIAEGFHKKFGGDHAEIVALKTLKSKRAAADVKGATLYVTLEPCHHFGKTPPCVDAVIKSGVSRVVIAIPDPNPKTAGNSIAKMQRAGIAVRVGVCAKEARDMNRAFIKHITTGLPYVIVKVAQSQDGMISTQKGKQGWITGPEAKKYVQRLRRDVDAVLVGRGTAEIDNPRLTVRRAKAMQPRRVILDSDLNVSLQSKLFNTLGGQVVLICSDKTARVKIRRFEKAGIVVLPVKKKRAGLDLHQSLKKLGQIGIASILVEGGAEVFTSFLKSKLADEWQIITAPKIVGIHGQPAFLQGLGLPKLKFKFKCELGSDQLRLIGG